MSEIKTTILPIVGLNCASCAQKAEKTISLIPGVKDSSVNFASKELHVAFLPRVTNLQEMQKAVQAVGYDLIIEEKECHELEMMHKRDLHKLRRKTIASALFSVPLVVIAMFFENMPFGNEIMWLLATPVVLWFGKDFFVNAWKQAKHGSANMDTLVALSSGIAYLFSVFNMLNADFWNNKGFEGHVYFEAASVIITFILLGRLLEEKAKDNT
ncbi:MAG: cation transporter, partial [Draconibacterium sp.]